MNGLFVMFRLRFHLIHNSRQVWRRCMTSQVMGSDGSGGESDANCSHNRNALRIIESIGVREELSSGCALSDKYVSQIYLDFMTICPKYYAIEDLKIRRLVRVLSTLSDSHLISILRVVILWQKTNGNSFQSSVYKMWSHLDNELTLRLNMNASIDSWRQELPQKLLIANLFCELNVGKYCKFNKSLIRLITNRQLSLTKEELLHILFYMNINRIIDAKYMTYICEQTERLIDGMDLDEMSIVCMSFLKTDTKLTHHLLRSILRNTLSSISNQTNSFTKTDILKAIRFSYDFIYKQEVYKLIEKYKHLDNNVFALIQLIRLLNESKLYDQTLIDETFARFDSTPHDFRHKYIDRLLLCANDFNHVINYNTLDNISKHFIENSKYFSEYLPNILTHFCFKHFYPRVLIERCFDYKSIKLVENCADPNFKTSLLKLNSCLSIEKYGEYSHLLLKGNELNRLSLKGVNRRQGLQPIWKLFEELKRQLGSSRVHLCPIFPFTTQPIIIISSNSTDLSFDCNYSELREGMFDNYKAVHVIHFNDYSLNDRSILKSGPSLEIRLLERLGFQLFCLDYRKIMHFLKCKHTFDQLLCKRLQNATAIETIIS